MTDLRTTAGGDISRHANGATHRGFIYVMLFLLTTISYVDRTTLSVAAPFIAEEFGLSPVAMGYLFSSFLWTYVLCLIPVGILVDRLGARYVAASGVTLWSLATVATGFVSSFGTLIATRLALGAGESTAYPAGVRVVRDCAPERERGLATAFLNGGSYAGPALGALMTAWLIAAFGWRWSFIVIGILGLLWVVPWLLRFKPPQAGTVMAGMDTSHPPLAPTPLKALLRDKSIWGMALTQGCAVYTQYLFLAWLPSYLQQTKNLDVQNAGLFTALPYAASVVLALLICHCSDRMLPPGSTQTGRRRFMVAATLMLASGIFLVPFLDSLWAITLLIALSLTGVSSAISLNFALASDLMRSPADAGKVAGILVFGGNIFGILAPIVTGYVIVGTGSYNSAFVIAGGILLAGATIAVTVVKPRVQQ